MNLIMIYAVTHGPRPVGWKTRLFARPGPLNRPFFRENNPP
jgi:hypothetical protein